MATENVSVRYRGLDSWPLEEAVETMWEAQLAAVAAVRPALPEITAAARAASQRLGAGGRLVYVGAGTSGRVAAQDGAELPPTFGWPVERAIFIFAGGEAAMLRSVEGAEDDRQDARRQIDAHRVNAADVLIGVAASGTTPFTVEAVERAQALGALTIAIANNPEAPLLARATHAIVVATGGEALAGSTRMKAGTAQKVVLNLLSTAIMMQLGGVYEGMMVGMRAANEKLRARAQRMVSRIAGCGADQARRALEASGYDVKTASLIATGIEGEQARALLKAERGDLRAALARALEGA